MDPAVETIPTADTFPLPRKTTLLVACIAPVGATEVPPEMLTTPFEAVIGADPT